MPAIPSTSGTLHSEFIRLFFLQAHRETDRFFLQLQEFSLRNMTVDSSTSAARRSLRKVGSTLAKTAALRVNLNIDGAPITCGHVVFTCVLHMSGPSKTCAAVPHICFIFGAYI